MVTYTCEHCGFSVNDKSRFKRHLNRKNPCFIHDNTKELNQTKNIIPSQILTNSLTNPHKPSQILTNLNNENGCIYCGKTFKRKDNLKRHMESYCKIMKSQMILIESEKSILLDKNAELINKTIELENKVKQLNNELINKPTTNITNINTINNIKINNYGCENLDYLTSEKINKLIETPYTSIPKLIEEVHYHPDHPENNNMKITNKRDSYIKL